MLHFECLNHFGLIVGFLIRRGILSARFAYISIKSTKFLPLVFFFGRLCSRLSTLCLLFRLFGVHLCKRFSIFICLAFCVIVLVSFSQTRHTFKHQLAALRFTFQILNSFRTFWLLCGFSRAFLSLTPVAC